MYGSPPTSPASNTGTIPGWSSTAAARRLADEPLAGRGVGEDDRLGDLDHGPAAELRVVGQEDDSTRPGP